MTSPGRWVTLVRLEAAQTTWTGSGETQTSVAALEENSLQEKKNKKTELESGELRFVDDIT